MTGRKTGFALARAAVLAATAALALGSCAGPAAAPSPRPPSPPSVTYPLAEHLDAAARRWVDRTMKGMTLEQEVAQLVFPWASGAYSATTGPDFEDLLAQVKEGVGGFVISIGLPYSYAAKLNALQRRAEVPLLVASDFESGGPGMRMNHIYALPSLLPQGGGTSFPPTMAFGAIGDTATVRRMARITAEEARAVGVQLDFAPVLDVNSNPDNPVINTRSFGEDPRAVARLGAAFIRGAHQGGVMTTAKHFPGHGDTKTDSHIALPIVPADRARLDSVDLVPFRRAIASGVDAVMTAHVMLPEILGPDAPPATLSPFFVDRLLRGELGFTGLAVTDALDMGAITNGYGIGESAVKAVEAGTDVLLDPANPDSAIDAVVAAVKSGRISEDRIRSSVRRILEMKARAGLNRRRTVDLDAIDRIVGTGPHLAFADSTATRSITLARDREHLVPVRPDSVDRILSITWTRPGDPTGSSAADAMLRERYDHVRTVQVSEADGPEALDALWNDAWSADRVLVNPYVAYQAGTGTIGVPEMFSRFVQRLAVHRPVVVTSFGNPYLLSAFPNVGTYMLAWGGREVSERAAVRAWTGEAAITGKLPISLPPYHRVGDGLHRDSVTAPPCGAAGGASGASCEGGAPTALEQAGVVARRKGATGVNGPPLARMTVSSAEAPAADAGMSEAMLARLDTAVLEAIADSAAPGAAVAVGRGDKLVRLRGYGRIDWARGSAPATPTTLYDLASLTKAVGTTTAVMQLVDSGRISLDDHVVKYLPWWAAGDARKKSVTIRQLLLHRGGLPPFEPFWKTLRGRAAYERAVGALKLDYAPGTKTVYSDLGFMTLGWVVERVTGQSLDAYLKEHVWTPLGMEDTRFRPDSTDLPRVAYTEVDTVFRHTHVHGVVHDENAYAMGGVSGHAGLFSSAADLAVFADALLEGGALEPCDGTPSSSISCTVPWAPGGRIVSKATLDRFTRRFDDSSSRALGWDTPSGRSSAGDYFTADSFGHTGFTGTSIWIDPDLDLFVVLLTNRVDPTRANEKHLALRRRVADLAARAITDRPVEKVR